MFFNNNSRNRWVVELALTVHQLKRLSGLYSHCLFCLSTQCIFEGTSQFHSELYFFISVFCEFVFVKNTILLFTFLLFQVFNPSKSARSGSFTFINFSFVLHLTRLANPPISNIIGITENIQLFTFIGTNWTNFILAIFFLKWIFLGKNIFNFYATLFYNFDPVFSEFIQLFFPFLQLFHQNSTRCWRNKQNTLILYFVSPSTLIPIQLFLLFGMSPFFFLPKPISKKRLLSTFFQMPWLHYPGFLFCTQHYIQNFST